MWPTPQWLLTLLPLQLLLPTGRCEEAMAFAELRCWKLEEAMVAPPCCQASCLRVVALSAWWNSLALLQPQRAVVALLPVGYNSSLELGACRVERYRDDAVTASSSSVADHEIVAAAVSSEGELVVVAVMLGMEVVVVVLVVLLATTAPSCPGPGVDAAAASTTW